VNIENHPYFRLETIPEPPETLSKAAKAEWEELLPVIVGLGTARPADLRILALLCEVLADISGMESAIREQGYTTASAAGSLKTHPALKPLDAARRQAAQLLGQLQCAPTGRQRDRFSEGRWKHLFG
jgi:P27 family predicted phage terminase small subunit